MQRRIGALVIGSGCLATLMGCGGSAQSSSLSVTVPPPSPALAASHQGDSAIACIGTWDLAIDPNNLTATITPSRHGLGIQGKLYDLDISAFLRSGLIGVDSVEGSDDSQLQLNYRVTHPFAAPKIGSPISATNRADLSVTGAVVFLPPTGVFDPFVSDPSTGASVPVYPILNADTFIRTGDLTLVDMSTSIANTWPAKLIVDEALGPDGNRIGVGNAGSARGNYQAATGGWTVNDLGASGDHWTGFDVLHAGQSATNSVIIDRRYFQNNTPPIQIAVMIKYTDPRGVPYGQNQQVRMPQDPADATVFAYREPNGALDASKWIPGSEMDPLTREITIPGSNGSNFQFTIALRDWDARAIETSEPVLDADPLLSHVNIGTSGAPVVTLVATPFMSGDATLISGGQSGQAGQEIVYTANVSVAGDFQPGQSFYGLLRAVDPEATAPDRDSYAFGVDPVTLAGDPARAITPTNYYPLTFRVVAPVINCGSLAINEPDPFFKGDTFTLNLAGINDPTDSFLSIRVRYEGATISSSGYIALTAAERALETAFNPFTDPRLSQKLLLPTENGAYSVYVDIGRNQDVPVTCNFSWFITNNQPPNTSAFINPSGGAPPPAVFTLDLTATTDPESDDIAFRVRYEGAENDQTDWIVIPYGDLPNLTALDPFDPGTFAFPLRPIETQGTYQVFFEYDDGHNVEETYTFWSVN
ncbi:MAG: hypothetical protein ABI743_07690 [bacterium]